MTIGAWRVNTHLEQRWSNAIESDCLTMEHEHRLPFRSRYSLT